MASIFGQWFSYSDSKPPLEAVEEYLRQPPKTEYDPTITPSVQKRLEDLEARVKLLERCIIESYQKDPFRNGPKLEDVVIGKILTPI